MYGNGGYVGKAYKYDVTSFYPWIMIQMSFLVPIKRGAFNRLTKKAFDSLKFFTYGIYRCVIDGDAKCFRKNRLNYYTHYDLNIAKEIGLKLSLIVDDQPNYLSYFKDQRISGNTIFGQFVETLFKLKKDGVFGAKVIMNCLWGVLVQEKMKNYTVGPKDPMLEIWNDKTILSIKPNDQDNSRIDVEFVNNEGSFQSNFGRLKTIFIKQRKVRDIQYYETTFRSCSTMSHGWMDNR